MTVKLVQFVRRFEWRLEVRRKEVVLCFAGVNVDGGFVVEMTINKVNGKLEILVFRRILTWVYDVVNIAQVWIFKNINLQRKEIDAILG